MSEKQGSLIIAGCGLHPGHMTLETKSVIENAEKVLLVAPNPLSIRHIIELNPATEHLGKFYNQGLQRPDIYRQMAKYIIELVRAGHQVCTVFYGHPGVFVSSTRMASRVLKEQGYEVSMLPGIAADACLYADLDLDPAETGCQSYEATRFLMTRREVDNSAALILWQLGLTGEHTMDHFKKGEQGLTALARLLLEKYPAEHQVCLYEAPTLPGFRPRQDWLTLAELEKADVSLITTLFVPACKEPEFAEERLSWLGLSSKDIEHWEEFEEVDA
ncbi:MAG: SAM-dependent methyltransferase [Aestuariibacter sp.]